MQKKHPTHAIDGWQTVIPAKSDPTESIDTAEMAGFRKRVAKYWPDLVKRLEQVYGQRPDLETHLNALKLICWHAWRDRDAALKRLDHQRPAESLWYAKSDVVGASLYVDLFAETLNGLRSRLDYLSDLGINYIHCMPIFRAPEGNNDGGYAVSSFREIEPRLGHIDDLRALSDEMRARGMALVVDFIFNHTSDEHPWALAAKAGDARYVNYYRTFDSPSLISAYQKTLREIFPTIRRGSFSWSSELERWVWTSFNSFQWDLNYDNPALFVSMVAEMLYLANCGIDVLRFDAVAFIWKRLGTDCENLPEAHLLIQAFNFACRISAPAVVFKSEAIVHPDDVRSYIDPHECQLSYNPNLMALLWESVATRKTELLRQALGHRQVLPPATTWVNYLRCHDDIGWCFDDGDAQQLGINPFEHRKFLNQFYSGRFEGSFARGVPFQYNPSNEDMRICGTFASLIGIESALEAGDREHLEMAFQRARMLFGVLMSIGGIPLVYMGEELGLLNDYGYEDRPAQKDDSRWVHRIAMDWDLIPSGGSHGELQSRFYTMLKGLISHRKLCPALDGTQIEILQTESAHLLAYCRPHPTQPLVVLANFSEQVIPLRSNLQTGALPPKARDLLSNKRVTRNNTLEPYALHWLV